MDFKLDKRIRDHYTDKWNNTPDIRTLKTNSNNAGIDNFHVLVFRPNENRDMWTYATCGMSTMKEKTPLELHIFSKNEDNELVELLTAIAYYHRKQNLDLSHTINFGRSWADNSKCDHGLISLPYLDGPKLENLYIPSYDENIKFYWLIPIMKNEVDYKKKYGIDALEDKFDSSNFNYLDASRQSVIE